VFWVVIVVSVDANAKHVQTLFKCFQSLKLQRVVVQVNLRAFGGSLPNMQCSHLRILEEALKHHGWDAES